MWLGQVWLFKKNKYTHIHTRTHTCAHIHTRAHTLLGSVQLLQLPVLKTYKRTEIEQNKKTRLIKILKWPRV